MTSIGSARTGAPASDQPQLANWKVGAALGTIAGIASFQHSLLPRTGKQQAIVTAASIALGFGAGAAANALANAVDRHTDLDAVGSRLAIGGAGALAVLGTGLAMRGRPSPLALDAARTAAGVAGAGAIAGAALIGEQALVDRISPDLPGGAAAAHAAIIGAATLGAGALLLGRARATGVTADAERAYVQSTLDGATLTPPAFDPDRFTELTALRRNLTTVSGVTADTLLPDTTLTEHGLKFINEVTPKEEIARVMGVDVATAADPVRVYGGMYHGAPPDELAQRILDESIARGAFDKSRIVLYVPSGSGHVNPMPVAASEYETLGDIASVGMQYGRKPSIQSLDKVDDATALFRSVLEKFRAHVETLPADSRPKLAAYGESLGAWSMQDTWLASGVDGLASSGLDEVINVGSPRFSGMRSNAIGLAGHRMDASGRLFEFNDIGELRALDPTTRDGLRAFLLTHHNDPVNKFSPAMFLQRPEWLASAEHATGVPRKMKWLPGVSGLQGVMDTVNGTNPNAGILARTGHDYRADMAPVMAEVLGTGTTDEQLARIGDALTQLELARVDMPKPTPRLAAAVA